MPDEHRNRERRHASDAQSHLKLNFCPLPPIHLPHPLRPHSHLGLEGVHLKRHKPAYRASEADDVVKVDVSEVVIREEGALGWCSLSLALYLRQCLRTQDEASFSGPRRAGVNGKGVGETHAWGEPSQGGHHHQTPSYTPRSPPPQHPAPARALA